MSEEFPMSNDIENINQVSETTDELVEEYPEYDKEKAQQLRDEYNNNSSGNVEVVNDKERLMVEQQREDLSVLFSFCDEKDIMDILNSDEYGKLLENQISLMDLFNANALFNEQYYEDGFTKDYNKRYYTYDGQTKLDNFKDDRKRHIEDKYEKIGEYQSLASELSFEGVSESGIQHILNVVEEYKNDERGGTYEDKIRANDAKNVISDIANEYLNRDSDSNALNNLKEIIKVRADYEHPQELSDEQKDFLKSQGNIISDRLLYDGMVINEERAQTIFDNLKLRVEAFESIEENSGKEEIRDFCKKIGYSVSTIEDYKRAGRPDLVSDSIELLEDTVDKHFGELFSNKNYLYIGDYYGNFAYKLFLDYSNPWNMIENAKKYDLVSRYNEHGEVEHRGLFVSSDLELVFERIAATKYNNTDIYLSYKAKDLKEFGVDDDTILKYCDNLHPVDFVNAETIDGTGTRFLEAGINRQKVLDKIFSSNGWGHDPFKKQGYPFEGESYFDVLERNGFSATEIAQTFSPDEISENLAEFLDRGADAKELIKYMFSYHEEFEGNRMLNKDGETVGYYRMWFEGNQDMIVWDKNHPNGRSVVKIGMPYRGVDYVAANLDLLAENGITEDDIFNSMPDNYANPNDSIIQEMVKCKKFDTNKVLRNGYEKEENYLKARLESGDISEDYVKIALDQIRYVSDVFRKINDNDEFSYNPVRDIKRAITEKKTNTQSQNNQ